MSAIRMSLWPALAGLAGLFCISQFVLPRGPYVQASTDPAAIQVPHYPEVVARRATPANAADSAWRQPIFYRERQPRIASLGAGDDGSDPTSTAASLDATLTGIVLSGPVSFASLNTGGTSVRVPLGGEATQLPGWRLVSVTPDSARFSNGSAEVELRIDRRAPASGSDAGTPALKPPTEVQPVVPTPTLAPENPPATQTEDPKADALRQRIDAARRSMTAPAPAPTQN